MGSSQGERKLTQERCDKARPRASEFTLWDASLGGRFGLRVRPEGSKTFVLQYRTRAGRQRKFTIGGYGKPWTLTSARDRAAKLLRRVDAGEDPAEDRDADRQSITLAELLGLYFKKHAPKKAARSVAEDGRLAKRVLEPALGKRRVREITPADCDNLHASLAATPYQANRAIALLRKVLGLAERWGHRTGQNPASRVALYPEEGRERFLSDAELERLGTVLADCERERSEPESVLAAVRFLLLSGFRVGEALGLRWGDLRPDLGLANLPDTKTGKATRFLGAPALALLDAQKRVGPFVFPSPLDPERPLATLGRPWRRIRERAGLAGVRVHDLRHTHASAAASGGVSLLLTSKLLGHASARTSQRYSHLGDDPVRQAADFVSGRIAAAMDSKKPAGTVLPLRQEEPKAG